MAVIGLANARPIAPEAPKQPQLISISRYMAEPITDVNIPPIFDQIVRVPRSKNKKVEKKSYSRPRKDLPQKVSLQFRRFSIKSCMFPLLGGRLSARSPAPPTLSFLCKQESSCT